MSRGRKTVRDIIKEEPSTEERKALRRTFAQLDAPPIVVAILGLSLLDYDVENLLRPRFKRNDDKTWRRLTGEHGPLGTFSAKVTAAHGLGLITEEQRTNCIIVKNIRNAFAHSKKLIDFSNPLVRGELAEMALPAKNKSQRSRDYQYLQNVFLKNDTEEGGQFSFILLCLLLNTDFTASELKRIKSKKARAKRKQRNSPFFNALAHSLRDPQTGLPLSPGGLFGGSYSAGPTNQESLQSYGQRILELAKSLPSGILTTVLSDDVK